MQKKGLKEIKIQSPDKLILGHLNINSVRNKFEALTYLIDNNIDLLVISETKLDDSFPTAQFEMKDFSVPYRSDRNGKGGGLLLYIREDIQSKLLISKSKCNTETLPVAVNLRKRKWFLNCSYNTHQNLISNHLECLNRLIDEHSNSFDNFIFLGDFNVSTNHDSMINFCDLNGLRNLINVPTCYKNSDNPTSIDLILTNRPSYFQHSTVFETGLSDFHLLNITEFRTSFHKREPKIIKYRDYKNFDNKFRSEILKCNFDYTDLRTFKETIFNIFSKYAPTKKRYVRANEAPFMTKELHKAIMKRSRLRNKFLKDRTENNQKNFKLQRNFCKDLLRTTEKSYYSNLDIKKVTDNKTFWKTIILFFTKRPLKGETINLIENGKTISNDSELYNIFNDFFSNIISELNIPKKCHCFMNDMDSDSVLSVLNAFENHPSIKNIKSKKFNSTFSFENTYTDVVMKVINNLNVAKSCQINDIPTKVIKINKDIFANFITDHFNYCIAYEEFPDELKHTDVIPVHKRNEKCDKTNYRPVSIVINISKIYDKLLYNQLFKYFDSLIATNQCEFRKGFSSQYCLLVMLEKFKETIDRGNQFGALLTNLSKAFDYIDHKLLIAKLYEYYVSSSALNVISSYLKHRTQRTKINDCFSARLNIEYGVPQGSILGSLLFNINMIDLFYQCEENDIANYADDTTPYSCGTDITTVISELQAHFSTKVFDWSGNNHMKANPGKSDLLLSTKSPKVVSIDRIQMKSSTTETLLGITIDSELHFDNHLFAICKKLSRKINALGLIANYMSLEKRRILRKTFIESQFNYCPLIWMFHSRTINNKINRLHERALRIVYSDFKSFFEGLLMKDNSFSIHERNIQSLAIEICQFLNGLSPNFLNNVFQKDISNSYDLQNHKERYSRNP